MLTILKELASCDYNVKNPKVQNVLKKKGEGALKLDMQHLCNAFFFVQAPVQESEEKTKMFEQIQKQAGLTDFQKLLCDFDFNTLLSFYQSINEKETLSRQVTNQSIFTQLLARVSNRNQQKLTVIPLNQDQQVQSDDIGICSLSEAQKLSQQAFNYASPQTHQTKKLTESECLDVLVPDYKVDRLLVQLTQAYVNHIAQDLQRDQEEATYSKKFLIPSGSIFDSTRRVKMYVYVGDKFMIERTIQVGNGLCDYDFYFADTPQQRQAKFGKLFEAWRNLYISHDYIYDQSEHLTEQDQNKLKNLFTVLARFFHFNFLPLKTAYEEVNEKFLEMQTQYIKPDGFMDQGYAQACFTDKKKLIQVAKSKLKVDQATVETICKQRWKKQVNGQDAQFSKLCVSYGSKTQQKGQKGRENIVFDEKQTQLNSYFLCIGRRNGYFYNPIGSQYTDKFDSAMLYFYLLDENEISQKKSDCIRLSWNSNNPLSSDAFTGKPLVQVCQTESSQKVKEISSKVFSKVPKSNANAKKETKDWFVKYKELYQEGQHAIKKFVGCIEDAPYNEMSLKDKTSKEFATFLKEKVINFAKEIDRSAEPSEGIINQIGCEVTYNVDVAELRNYITADEEQTILTETQTSTLEAALDQLETTAHFTLKPEKRNWSTFKEAYKKYQKLKDLGQHKDALKEIKSYRPELFNLKNFSTFDGFDFNDEEVILLAISKPGANNQRIQQLNQKIASAVQEFSSLKDNNGIRPDQHFVDPSLEYERFQNQFMSYDDVNNNLQSYNGTYKPFTLDFVKTYFKNFFDIYQSRIQGESLLLKMMFCSTKPIRIKLSLLVYNKDTDLKLEQQLMYLALKQFCMSEEGQGLAYYKNGFTDKMMELKRQFQSKQCPEVSSLNFEYENYAWQSPDVFNQTKKRWDKFKGTTPKSIQQLGFQTNSSGQQFVQSLQNSTKLALKAILRNLSPKLTQALKLAKKDLAIEIPRIEELFTVSLDSNKTHSLLHRIFLMIDTAIIKSCEGIDEGDQFFNAVSSIKKIGHKYQLLPIAVLENMTVQSIYQCSLKDKFTTLFKIHNSLCSPFYHFGLQKVTKKDFLMPLTQDYYDMAIIRFSYVVFLMTIQTHNDERFKQLWIYIALCPDAIYNAFIEFGLFPVPVQSQQISPQSDFTNQISEVKGALQYDLQSLVAFKQHVLKALRMYSFFLENIYQQMVQLKNLTKYACSFTNIFAKVYLLDITQGAMPWYYDFDKVDFDVQTPNDLASQIHQQANNNGNRLPNQNSLLLFQTLKVNINSINLKQQLVKPIEKGRAIQTQAAKDEKDLNKFLQNPDSIEQKMLQDLQNIVKDLRHITSRILQEDKSVAYQLVKDGQKLLIRKTNAVDSQKTDIIVDFSQQNLQVKHLLPFLDNDIWEQGSSLFGIIRFEHLMQKDWIVPDQFVTLLKDAPDPLQQVLAMFKKPKNLIYFLSALYEANKPPNQSEVYVFQSGNLNFKTNPQIIKHGPLDKFSQFEQKMRRFLKPSLHTVYEGDFAKKQEASNDALTVDIEENNVSNSLIDSPLRKRPKLDPYSEMILFQQNKKSQSHIQKIGNIKIVGGFRKQKEEKSDEKQADQNNPQKKMNDSKKVSGKKKRKQKQEQKQKVQEEVEANKQVFMPKIMTQKKFSTQQIYNIITGGKGDQNLLELFNDQTRQIFRSWVNHATRFRATKTRKDFFHLLGLTAKQPSSAKFLYQASEQELQVMNVIIVLYYIFNTVYEVTEAKNFQELRQLIFQSQNITEDTIKQLASYGFTSDLVNRILNMKTWPFDGDLCVNYDLFLDLLPNFQKIDNFRDSLQTKDSQFCQAVLRHTSFYSEDFLYYQLSKAEKQQSQLKVTDLNYYVERVNNFQSADNKWENLRVCKTCKSIHKTEAHNCQKNDIDSTVSDESVVDEIKQSKKPIMQLINNKGQKQQGAPKIGIA